MTKPEIDELIATLKRIATALEVANLKSIAPLAPSPSGGGGTLQSWTCQRCGGFVVSGMTHYCYGSSGGTVTGCSTPSCWLTSGHEGACQPVTIT